MRWMALFLLAAGCAAPATAPSRASDFELPALDGPAVRGSSLWKEKPVLLVFMTSWCAKCRLEVPELNALAQKHSVVAISTGDKREDVVRVRRETGMKYPVLLDDGRVARAFAIEETPTCIWVDRGGAILSRDDHPPAGLR